MKPGKKHWLKWVLGFVIISMTSPLWGAPLPPQAVSVGLNRYRTASLKIALDYYQKWIQTNKSYQIEKTVDLPWVISYHIKNPFQGYWEGINISYYKGGCYLYIIKKSTGKWKC